MLLASIVCYIQSGGIPQNGNGDRNDWLRNDDAELPDKSGKDDVAQLVERLTINQGHLYKERN